MSNGSSESRNLVEKLYQAALSGDIASVYEILDDDVLVLEPSFLPYGGEVRGKEAFGGLLQSISACLDLSTMTLESMVADGDTVVAFLHAKTATAGEDVALAERSIVRNGKVVEMKIFYHEGGDLFPRAPRQ